MFHIEIILHIDTIETTDLLTQLLIELFVMKLLKIVGPHVTNPGMGVLEFVMIG